MGSLKVTVCTSVLVAAVLTPAAYAVDAGGVSVTPATPAPGSDVTLRVPDCAERTAVARSAAFVADARLTVHDGELVGESRVRSTLDAGTYAVKVTCGGAERTGTFTVREGREGEERQRPAPGTDEHVSVPGTDEHASVPGTGGQPPAPGTVGQPPAPDTVGQPPMPEGGGQSSTPGDDEQQSASRRPGPYASPVAPVQAGGGGAADLVAAEDRGPVPVRRRG
ncbi:hypothetical protein STAFG_5261 [Streptomyces afghaniensis 772]|uniref:Uncharacterized protein n=1 Tax=Streptomyces afghaniensis 772 TaxID=1283301 RepID=S4MDU3_9ACTN|nr:hypothetical protein [Streptomyces afghaniensis]EPJ37683.1 hypothetical protein STAFG_5261 [Streptomyces afghaniensis 772]